MSRKVLWAVMVIGILLVVAPFAINLPGKASAGQKMIDNFHGIMQPGAVKQTVDYYNNTFVPLGSVAQGGVQAAAEVQQMTTGLASALHMTPAQVQQFLGSNYPAMAKLLGSFPQLVPIFKNVPPGLDFYKPLVTTMNNNVHNYKEISSLPNFNLFTWFFVVPGALLVILSGLGLALGRRQP